MKRILILNAGDFDGDNKSLSSLKNPIKNWNQISMIYSCLIKEK